MIHLAKIATRARSYGAVRQLEDECPEKVRLGFHFVVSSFRDFREAASGGSTARRNHLQRAYLDTSACHGRKAIPNGRRAIEIDSIAPIGFPDITPELARESGFQGIIDLLKVAKHGKGTNIYLIRFHYVSRLRTRGDVVPEFLVSNFVSSGIPIQSLGPRRANLASQLPTTTECFGIHAERGRITIRNLATHMAGHDADHVEEICRILSSVNDEGVDSLARTLGSLP